MEDKHLSSAGNYTDENIRTMEGMKHIRHRPGMYIGGLGNGTDPRHGIYTILKEVIDNSVDEFTMGFSKNIIVDVDEKTASVRDYGYCSTSKTHRHRFFRRECRGLYVEFRRSRRL